MTGPVTPWSVLEQDHKGFMKNQNVMLVFAAVLLIGIGGLALLNYSARMKLVGDWRCGFTVDPSLKNTEQINSLRLYLRQDGTAEYAIESSREVDVHETSYSGSVSSSGSNRMSRSLKGTYRIKDRMLTLEFPTRLGYIETLEPFVVKNLKTDEASDQSFLTVAAAFDFAGDDLFIKPAGKPRVYFTNVLAGGKNPFMNQYVYTRERPEGRMVRRRVATDDIGEQFKPQATSYRVRRVRAGEPPAVQAQVPPSPDANAAVSAPTTQEYWGQPSGAQAPPSPGPQYVPYQPSTAAVDGPGADAAAAKSTLRMLATASEAYATINHGNYPGAEGDLTGAVPPYLNFAYCNQVKTGYRFSCHFSPSGYEFKATPVNASEGVQPLTITTGGVLTGDDTGGYDPRTMEAATPDVEKTSSYEALAKATLRTLSTASESYATANSGNYPSSINDLTGATPPYLNNSYCGETISNYHYECAFSTNMYEFKAVSIVPEGAETGRSFKITTGGVISDL